MGENRQQNKGDLKVLNEPQNKTIDKNKSWWRETKMSKKGRWQ